MPHRIPAAYPSNTRIGRRGACLFFFGTIYSLIGWSFQVTPLSPAGRTNLLLALNFLEIHLWGVVWIATGGLAIAAAFLHVGRDGWGFIPLLVLTITWSGFYAAAVIAYWFGALDLPAPLSAIGFALTYMLLAGIIAVIAGWTEPVEPVAAPDPPREPSL